MSLINTPTPGHRGRDWVARRLAHHHQPGITEAESLGIPAGNCIEFDAILLGQFDWPDRWADSPPVSEDHNRKAAMTAEQRRLRAALDHAERSASWLGRKVGVSPMTVSRWLGNAKGDHGTRVPEDKRADVAAALGTTVRDLFTERKKAA